jgi:hypothetical protein
MAWPHVLFSLLPHYSLSNSVDRAWRLSSKYSISEALSCDRANDRLQTLFVRRDAMVGTVCLLVKIPLETALFLWLRLRRAVV